MAPSGPDAASRGRAASGKGPKTDRKRPLRRKRAPRGEREQQIIAAAAELFATKGFDASTRVLARRLGVTQALIYRYFKSKQMLIDRVFADVFVDQWDESSVDALLDQRQPLASRLTAFYQGFAQRFTSLGVRLFLRAELDDQKLAARYTVPLNERMLTPVITALRREAGLPPPDKRPIMRAERELAMTLHGAIAHLGIRKFIYDSPLPDDLSGHVAFYVSAFLEGAVVTIRRLHENQPAGMLGERLDHDGSGEIE